MKFLAGVLLIIISSSSAADSLYTRDLACEQQFSIRAKEICYSLERALKWTWTGHAFISPSYRINVEDVRKVYCSLPVAVKDTETLVEMVLNSELKGGMRQMQINIGVRDLLLMLGQNAIDRLVDLEKRSDKSRRLSMQFLKALISNSIAENSTSIFNPSHRYYILKDGCS